MGYRFSRAALLVAVLLIASAPVVAVTANTVFTDDFEDGDIAEWTTSVEVAGSQSASTNSPINGTYSYY